MNEMQQLPIRLALRHEGSMWNAYVVDLRKEGERGERILIGSIAIAAVAENPERRQVFKELMSSFVADMIEGITGHVPEMRETEALKTEGTA